jgi:glutathione synthase/RimK-type ligase-like ATP-grasp enzyme
MILVWGSRADAPTERVLDALKMRAAPVLLIEPDDLNLARFDLGFSPNPHGWLEVRERRVDVADVRGFFLRPLEAPTRNPSASAWDSLLGLADTMTGCVVNRPGPSRPNHSKPYQAQLIAAAGFDVPDTLVTTDAGAARAFLAEHRSVVYKSLSGIRSIVGRLDAPDAARFDEPTFGPVQLQAFVPGVDVRVHVVGSRRFACAARSTAIDYRYAAQQGASVELEAFDLPTEVGERIACMTEAMWLRVAGVDLRRTPEGRWVCLEVNPSPGFPWYEDATGHPIAAAIAEELDGATPSEGGR